MARALHETPKCHPRHSPYANSQYETREYRRAAINMRLYFLFSLLKKTVEGQRRRQKVVYKSSVVQFLLFHTHHPLASSYRVVHSLKVTFNADSFPFPFIHMQVHT